MVLNKDSLLKQGAPKIHEIELDSLQGEKVRVKEWDGKIRDAVNASGDKEISNHIVAQHSLCDENGGLVFENEDGMKALKTLKLKVIDELAVKCLKLNAVGSAEVEKAEKNLETTASADSISDSPVESDAPLTNSLEESAA